jgi:Flp pilus assembly protein TadG
MGSGVMVPRAVPCRPVFGIGQFRDCRKGVAAVEFALVVPVFILLLVAVMQFGLVLFTQNDMLNFARDTSRRVSVGEMSTADAQSAIEDRYSSYGADLIVTIDEPGGTDLRIAIGVPMDTAALIDPFGILKNYNINVEVRVRTEI